MENFPLHPLKLWTLEDNLVRILASQKLDVHTNPHNWLVTGGFGQLEPSAGYCLLLLLLPNPLLLSNCGTAVAIPLKGSYCCWSVDLLNSTDTQPGSRLMLSGIATIKKKWKKKRKSVEPHNIVQDSAQNSNGWTKMRMVEEEKRKKEGWKSREEERRKVKGIKGEDFWVQITLVQVEFTLVARNWLALSLYESEISESKEWCLCFPYVWPIFKLCIWAS